MLAGNMWRFCAVLALLGVLSAAPVAAQVPSFVINLRNTEIQAFSEQVSEITGRTLILDPAVRGQVTVISNTPLAPDGVWELYQAVLRVYGYAALRTGDVWRVVPQAGVTQGAGLVGGASGAQDFVTQVIRLQNLPSEEAVRALRPLVASFGFIDALNSPNGIIVTDTLENVDRIVRIATTLDNQPGDVTGTITLRYAGAREVGRILEEVLGGETAGLGAPRIAVDERSNTLLVRGDPYAIQELRELAATLDTPGGAAPETRVFRLRHSDAEAVTDVLRGLIGTLPADSPVPGALTDGAAGAVVTGGPGPGLLAAGAVAIQPAVDINAVVVRGPPAAIAEIGRLIQELDVRRPQVIIEAAIVEISGDIAEQLGIQFGLGQAAPGADFAATSFSLTGLSLRNILSILGVPASIGITNEGLSVGVGIGDEFGILIQALSQSSRANLLSTPSLTTLDNQPAEILVGQNVPFLTGTFATSGDPDDLFATIEREDVGITLRVVPRVHEGDVIRLEVLQEVSSIAPANLAGAVDLITNRRFIRTTVLADNGATIVLGGLITDDRLSTDSKVPILGDIPVLGALFRAEQDTRRRQTLFVFLRPTLLRNRDDVIGASQSRYERLREAQIEPLTRGSLLLEGDIVPTLPLEIEGIY